METQRQISSVANGRVEVWPQSSLSPCVERVEHYPTLVFRVTVNLAGWNKLKNLPVWQKGLEGTFFFFYIPHPEFVWIGVFTGQ